MPQPPLLHRTPGVRVWGGGGARGHSVGLFAVGGAHWPLALEPSDPLNVLWLCLGAGGGGDVCLGILLLRACEHPPDEMCTRALIFGEGLSAPVWRAIYRLRCVTGVLCTAA